MIEVKGNLWDYESDAVVITTNGYVKGNGEAVMGAGCAAEAKNKFPSLPSHLGRHLREQGNTLCIFWGMIRGYNGEDGTEWEQDLITFPVKHNWWEKADLDLIEKSSFKLRDWANECPHWKKILMPRPGCGNGGLDWGNVKPILEKYLDDRFFVITYG